MIIQFSEIVNTQKSKTRPKESARHGFYATENQKPPKGMNPQGVDEKIKRSCSLL